MAAKDRLYKGQPGTMETALFTAAKDYEGLVIWAVNNTATAVTLTLTHVDTASNSLPLVFTSIPANSIADIRIPVRILANEAVRGFQGTAGAITLFVDGVVS